MPRLTARTVILLATVAVGLMLLPLPDLGPVQGAIFDLLHAPLCALLGWVSYHGFRRWLPRNDFDAWLLVVTLVFLAGLAIEVAQEYIGRTAGLRDAVANGLGAASAMAWGYRAMQAPGFRRKLCTLLTVALFCAAAVRPVQVLAGVAAKRLRENAHLSTIEPRRADQDGG